MQTADNNNKVLSKLGHREDIKRRKELSSIALSNNEIVWKTKWKTKLKTRLRPYESLVKSILLNNCSGTWGLSWSDHKKLNSFHRKQLRRVIGIKWPHSITNKKLYQVTETQPLSIAITERWKLLGHILRLPANCPFGKAMRYYLEERTNEKFVGRKRTSIGTTINDVTWRTKQNHTDYQITPLISLVSKRPTQKRRTESFGKKLLVR